MFDKPSNVRNPDHDGPTVWLGAVCAYSLRLLVFLTETGLREQFDIVRCVPGDPGYRKMIRELTKGLGGHPTFPTIQHASGVFQSDSDVLIDVLCDAHGIDRDGLFTLPFYELGIYAAYGQLRAEVVELRGR